jgi:hypothetical protein
MGGMISTSGPIYGGFGSSFPTTVDNSAFPVQEYSMAHGVSRFDGFTTAANYPTQFQQVQQTAASTIGSPGFDLMKACREQHPHLFNESGQLKEGDAFLNAMANAGQPLQPSVSYSSEQAYQHAQQQAQLAQQQAQQQQQQVQQPAPIQPQAPQLPVQQQAKPWATPTQAQPAPPPRAAPFDLEASRRIANQ